MRWIVLYQLPEKPEKIKAWTFLPLPLAQPPPSYSLVAVGVGTVDVVIGVGVAVSVAAGGGGLAGLVTVWEKNRVLGVKQLCRSF